MATNVRTRRVTQSLTTLKEWELSFVVAADEFETASNLLRSSQECNVARFSPEPSQIQPRDFPVAFSGFITSKGLFNGPSGITSGVPAQGCNARWRLRI